MMEKERLKKLGLNLKVERTRKELTQDELAAKAGSSKNYIGSIERGIQNPSITKVIDIAAALEIDINTLIENV